MPRNAVLVTGAAGFIGSALCKRLVAEGFEVRALDDLSEGSETRLADAPEVDLVEGDIRDEGAVAKAAEGTSTIFHQGAKRAVQRSIEFPDLVTDVNVRGTARILTAAREAGAAVVAASSSSVYGNQPTYPVHEGMQLLPMSPYAASKAAGEVYCGMAWRTFGVPTVSLRYFNVYGPGQDPKNRYANVVPLFVTACLEGTRPTIHGDGAQARDFTYIDDVVEANLQAARAGSEAFGRALNIGGGERPTSVNELLAMIATLCGVDVDPLRADRLLGDADRTHADISLARSLIGFRPRVQMQEGLRRTVDAFRSSSSGPTGSIRP